MKRIMVGLLITLMCVCGVLPAAAAEELPDSIYATSSELFQVWASGGYPAYVCGVWTETGSMDQLTIAVTDDAAGEAGKQEILRLIADDSSVKFETRTYSYRQLEAVRDALMSYMGGENGIVSLGINEMENDVGVGIYADMAENAETQELVTIITKKFGDMVSIEWIEGRIMTSLGIYTADMVDIEAVNDEIGADGISPMWIGILSAIVLLFTLELVRLIRSRRAVVETASGACVTASDKVLSCREIENAIKNSEAEPSPDLEGRINAELDR